MKGRKKQLFYGTVIDVISFLNVWQIHYTGVTLFCVKNCFKLKTKTTCKVLQGDPELLYRLQKP